MRSPTTACSQRTQIRTRSSPSTLYPSASFNLQSTSGSTACDRRSRLRRSGFWRCLTGSRRGWPTRPNQRVQRAPRVTLSASTVRACCARMGLSARCPEADVTLGAFALQTPYSCSSDRLQLVLDRRATLSPPVCHLQAISSASSAVCIERTRSTGIGCRCVVVGRGFEPVLRIGLTVFFPNLQSHYVFMAGITYLYGLWNMNMLGDSSLVPSLNDAQLDIQACLTTLAALSGEWTTGLGWEHESRVDFFFSRSPTTQSRCQQPEHARRRSRCSARPS
jgi:hypothetical protein